MKKTIGIIGGMTPKSTILVYNQIIDTYQNKFNDYAFPKIIIYSVSFQDYIDWMKTDNWNAIASEITRITHSLHKSGADFCIIATNTIHKVFDQVVKSSPVPMIHIIDAVAEKICSSGVQKVILLGTHYTMKDTFYKERLNKYGIEALVPDPQNIEVINSIIFNELGKEIINPGSRKKILNILKKLKSQGAKGVILGCTELPLIINHKNSPLQIFDSVKILSHKALACSLS